jgi:ligand-binding SRPBCC domain-containing protein
MVSFEYEHLVHKARDETFAFFAEPSNLERLTPPLLRFRLVEAPTQMALGARIRYRITPLGLPIDWVAEVDAWNPPHSFSDVQLRGPYAAWRHTHLFVDTSGGTLIRDRIEYRLRVGRLGPIADRLGHRMFLERLFAYRSRRLDELLFSRP